MYISTCYTLATKNIKIKMEIEAFSNENVQYKNISKTREKQKK